MKYWQSHPGFLAVVVGLCLGSILLTETFASVRSAGQVIGAGKIESCSWPEEQKPFFLQAVKRLARDNESAEIRLESAKESERRQRAEADRILKATTPEKLKALQRENIQYATHGIDDRVCQGSGASATWISVVVRRKPEDIARDRKRIDDETNQPNPVRDDVFQGGPDVGPTEDSDICSKSPDSFHCLYGNLQIDKPSVKPKPPKRTKPPVVPSPIPGPQPVPFPGPTQDRTVADCQPSLDSRAQARLRRTGIELLDTMAAMGSQADHTLTAMGESILTQLAYFAQPNATVWEGRRALLLTGTQAVVDYMSNDNASNHRHLLQAAQKTSDTILGDPAVALGATAATVLTGKAASISGAACSTTVQRVKDVLVASGKAEKAAKRMQKILDTKAGIKNGVGSPCGVNPNDRKYACVPSSWAAELGEETGFQFNESHFRWEEADAPTKWKSITEVQMRLWGDRRFANHSPERAIEQSAGVPSLMPNGIHDVIQELEEAGDGARSFVYVERHDGKGHMLRGGNFGGVVHFSDPAAKKGGSYNFYPDQTGGPNRRIWHYRTRGPDLIP